MSSDTSSIGGYVDPNWPAPDRQDDAPYIIYGYTPSFVLALLGIILFTVAFIVHTIQVVYYRCWFFVPMAIACLFEIVGYVVRSLSAKIDPYRINYFIVQYFFIILAPVLISASIYTVLSSLIRRVGTQFSPISPKVVLWVFITADVVTTVIQAVGSGLVGARESNVQDPKSANDIILAGLAIQVFTFFVYLLLFSIFLWRARSVLFKGRQASAEHRAMSANSSPDSEKGAEVGDTRGRAVSKPFLVALTLATLMIYMRTCYRLSETAQYNYGSKAHNVKESLFGGLEFAPVVICVYLFIIWHPGRCVGRSVASN